MSDKPLCSLDQIQLEARLLAIENMFAGLFADINRHHGVTFDQFSTNAEKMQKELRQELIGQGADNPISWLVAAEVEQAITALLKKIADCTRIALPLDDTEHQLLTIVMRG